MVGLQAAVGQGPDLRGLPHPAGMPALGTPLSNFEVAQGPQERDPVTKKDGHKRRQDPSVTVRFKLEDEEGPSCGHGRPLPGRFRATSRSPWTPRSST